MGEARSRGTPDQRREHARARDLAALKEALGGGDASVEARIRSGLGLFLGRITPDEWTARRAAIARALREKTAMHRGAEPSIADAPVLRLQDDEIAWYLYLCEQAVEAPMCLELAQAQRCVPFVACLGASSDLATKISGFQRKLDELLSTYKTNPDGILFELLVALAYAKKGWDVEFIEETGAGKTPDFRARRGAREIHVECKRHDRRTRYSDDERQAFLEMWEPASRRLRANGQWLWMHVGFREEVHELSPSFLADLLTERLPLQGEEATFLDNEQALVRARRIDRQRVTAHLRDFRVKDGSPSIRRLLGGDWAPDDAAVTIIMKARHSIVSPCEVPALGRYVDDIAFASGITREFLSAASIEKKARDITKALSEAVKQLPDDGESIIHVACETMEGALVEERRSQKVLERIQSFVAGKPVAEVRLHRIHAHSRSDLLFELDERVDHFRAGWARRDPHVPEHVFLPEGSSLIDGNPWD